MSAETVTVTLLREIRQQFYQGNEKAFWQQRWLLIRAIAHPAKWMSKRQVVLPEDRYLAIFREMFAGIMRHGNSRVEYFAGYFLHVVQQHMKIRGDHYYQEGKALRSTVERTMSEIIEGVTKAEAKAASDSTCQDLAALTSLIKSPARKARKKPPITDSQAELF